VLVGAIAVVVVVALVLLAAYRSGSDSDSGTGNGLPRPVNSLNWTLQPAPVVTVTHTKTSSPSPSPSSSPTDPVATAAVGGCFHLAGPDDNAELTPTTCAAGTFKVLRINEGSTDLHSCADVPGDDENVSSKRYSRVLCLGYQSPGGDSYHAGQGDCVLGASGSPWSVQPCRAGAFKVLAVYRGTGDHSKCASLPHYNHWRTVPGPSGANQDVLQCLSMVFPDDAGYADVNQCLRKSGDTFTNVGDCDRSNVEVTGRTDQPADPAFCGRYAYTYWRSDQFPDLGYTVCWRWR
jgi:hypothetical protein